MACTLPLLSYDACSTYERKASKIKAISIKQPFASLITFGLKRIEVRSWATKMRGRVLVCSSKQPFTGKMLCPDSRTKTLDDARKFMVNAEPLFPFGKAIGMVDIVDCRPMTKEDAEAACIEFIPGHYAWVLENPIEVEPFNVSGQLSFFEVAANKIKVKSRL
jgi:hypothetical protein